MWSTVSGNDVTFYTAGDASFAADIDVYEYAYADGELHLNINLSNGTVTPGTNTAHVCRFAITLPPGFVAAHGARFGVILRESGAAYAGEVYIPTDQNT